MSDTHDNHPSHKVFVTEARGKDDKGNDKTWWTRIGTAWASSKGFTIALSAHPIGNRLVLLEFDDDEEPEEQPKERARRK